MKTLRILVFLFISLPGFLAAQEGIVFTSFEKWSEVLEKAAAEEKLIFMDAYTTWCGPCKMMNANIFPQESVGKYYNANFINVKVDMEKGEGIALAEKYAVNAYPTFLFIDSEGKLVHKGLGYQQAESFIDLGQAATDPDRQYGKLSELFATGQLDTDQHFTFANTALQVGDEKAAAQAAAVWFNAQQNKLTPEVMQFVLDYVYTGSGNPLYDFVIENRDAIVDELGRETVDKPLRNSIINSARASGDYSVGTVTTLLGQTFPAEMAQMYSAEYKMIFYTYFDRSNPDLKDKATADYLNTYLEQIEDWSMLNSAAWSVYENEGAAQEMVQSAVQWALRSVEISEQFFNTDTAAALYYRLGDKKEAMRWAEKAIELGKKEGQDVSDSENLLGKIRSMD